MNHYQILEVAKTASFSEIKSAFRRKVKLVHPDLNPGRDEQEFIRLNEAYEVLSDSTTRNLYDLYLDGTPLVTVLDEVTPQDKYRAQYIRDRIRKQRERIAYEIAIKQRVFWFLRMINAVAFFVAILLSYDYYFSSSYYTSVPEKVILGRDNTVIHFKTSVIKVENGFYPVYIRSRLKEVTLAYSGLLKIPIRVAIKDLEKQFFVSGNLYVFRNGFSVIMFLFSIVVVGNNRYSDFRLTCGLVSSFVLLWILLLLADYL